MKLNLRKTTAIAAMFAIVLGGAAQATEGWYGRLEAGYGFGDKIDFDSTTDAEFDDGWMGDVALGNAFGTGNSGLRLEGELSYRQNDISNASNADSNAQAAMLNGYWDFNRHGKVQPYLGLGVGYAKVELNGYGDDTDDSGAAYQAMAGLGIALSQRLTLDLGYKYFVAPNLDFVLDNPATFSGDYKHQAATVGLRWQFAAAPVAAPPAPPPEVVVPPVQVCPAQDFKVYFEWDRSTLNQAALDTINAAAARAKACNVATVKVIGYTDTSGSAKYNVGLSNRRAAVVRDALVSAGIATTSISTEGLGETNLDKATKDGVKEPLNRRTAVTISFQ